MNDILPQLADNTTELTQYFKAKKTGGPTGSPAVAPTGSTADDPPLIVAKIRKHNAIATFFENLNTLFSKNPMPRTPGKRTKATASYASGTHYTKDDILTIIRDMRNEGTTFAIIADYLRDKGIPTFSGRGEWHAQTIHRLCK